MSAGTTATSGRPPSALDLSTRAVLIGRACLAARNWKSPVDRHTQTPQYHPRRSTGCTQGRRQRPPPPNGSRPPFHERAPLALGPATSAVAALAQSRGAVRAGPWRTTTGRSLSCRERRSPEHPFSVSVAARLHAPPAFCHVAAHVAAQWLHVVPHAWHRRSPEPCRQQCYWLELCKLQRPSERGGTSSHSRSARARSSEREVPSEKFQYRFAI